MGWKGLAPEVQDAASTADLAEGARGRGPEPSHLLGTPVPSPGQPAPHRPLVPSVREFCTLAPQFPQPTQRQFSFVLLSRLTAGWQSATTVTGKVPSGMQPRLALLAGSFPAACSQLL